MSIIIVATLAIVAIVSASNRFQTVEEAADLKTVLNLVGGSIAVISGVLWINSAAVGNVAKAYNDKFATLSGALNLDAAEGAFLAALVFLTPFLMDSVGRRPPRA